MANNWKIHNINLAVQKLHLKKLFPNSDCTISHSCLRWTVELTPSPMCKTYKAQLTYKLNKNPVVRIIEPELIIPEGRRLPHVFSENRLCLYVEGEWRGDMLLSNSVALWISEWLLHYEIWLITGEWHGGGVHLDRKPYLKNANG